MPATRKGFTLIELLVVISIIALLIGILLPALGAARATARRMQSNTQIRGIHQAMVMFAQSNSGNFPGLDSSSNPVAPVTGQNFISPADDQNGLHVGTRLALMLNGNFFTPEYIISPADTNKTEAVSGGGDNTNRVTTERYSYAMSEIETSGQRKREWSETLNTEAAVMGDRARGTLANIYSIHTRQNSNDWRGGVARNDNSVSFETNHVLRTRFGSGTSIANDNIFEEGVAANGGPGNRALLVYSTTVFE